MLCGIRLEHSLNVENPPPPARHLRVCEGGRPRAIEEISAKAWRFPPCLRTEQPTEVSWSSFEPSSGPVSARPPTFMPFPFGAHRRSHTPLQAVFPFDYPKINLFCAYQCIILNICPRNILIGRAQSLVSRIHGARREAAFRRI